MTTILRTFAVLFGLLAVSNFLKPLELASDHGFVFFGRRLSGVPNAIAASSFAVFLAFYALAIWRERAHAFPMAVAYAGWVIVNMTLFQMRSPELAANSALFGIAYIVVAAGTALGAVAALLTAHVGHDAQRYENALKTFALLFGLLCVSNLLKPFAYTESVGFVLLGSRLSGMANIVAAGSFAIFLGVYGESIWAERKRALPLGVAYAIYVFVNLVAWNFRKPEGAETSLVFGVAYLAIAIGVSSGSAVLLYGVRDRLRP